MTVREKLEIEMDKEEIKKLEGENVDAKRSDKNNIFGSNDSTDTIRSN